VYRRPATIKLIAQGLRLALRKLRLLPCESTRKLWSNYGPVIVSDYAKTACGSHPRRGFQSVTTKLLAVTAEAWIRRSFRMLRTTDYATVVLPLPGMSNDLEVVRLL